MEENGGVLGPIAGSLRLGVFPSIIPEHPGSLNLGPGVNGAKVRVVWDDVMDYMTGSPTVSFDRAAEPRLTKRHPGLEGGFLLMKTVTLKVTIVTLSVTVWLSGTVRDPDSPRPLCCRLTGVRWGPVWRGSEQAEAAAVRTALS